MVKLFVRAVEIILEVVGEARFAEQLLTLAFSADDGRVSDVGAQVTFQPFINFVDGCLRVDFCGNLFVEDFWQLCDSFVNLLVVEV